MGADAGAGHSLRRCGSTRRRHGNAYAIDDAIRNLLENAVVHAPPRSEVTVSTRADGSVDVSDHGPGVASKDRERIFERFWRGKAASSQGAGLGLAIVAEIMKAHGGSVRVDAGPDGGAVFTLVFRPAPAAAPPAAKHELNVARFAGPARTRARQDRFMSHFPQRRQ